MGTAVANNDAVSTVLPPSSTKDKDAHIGMLVVFESTDVGMFADGAGQRGNDDSNFKSVAEVGHKDCAPINSIFTGEAIVNVVVIIVFVIVIISCDAVVEDGIGGAVVCCWQWQRHCP